MSSCIKFNKELNTLTAESVEFFDDAESIGVTILNNLKQFSPNKILEHHYESGTEVTSSDILEKSKRCAQNLEKYGIQKGDMIIIFSEVNEDITPLIIGCLLVGVVFSAIDADFNQDNTCYAVDILQPKAIFYDVKFLPKMRFLVSTSSLKLFLPFGDASQSVSNVLFNAIGEEFIQKDFGCAIPKITACVLFTSGTTGRPKAVNISQFLLRHNVLNWWTICSDDTLFVASQSRWINHLSLLLRPVLTGCLRIVSKLPVDPENVCKIVRTHHVTQFLGGVRLLSQMVVITRNKMCGSLNSLKGIAVTGDVPLKIRTAFKELVPGCKLISLYSMGEVGGVVAQNEFLEDKSINGGHLLPGFQVKVVDKDYNSLNPGECGVIFLRFSEGFLRYFKNNISSYQHFTDDDWFNTEDFGTIHEKGVIEVFGRCSDNIWCDGNLVGSHYFVKW